MVTDRIKRILFALVVFSFVTLLTMYVHTVYTLNINNNSIRNTVNNNDNNVDNKYGYE